ncbi:hypothetical protein [Crossiella cryophila]|uniref:Nucleotidyltransferase family protein n=1 Tax=Crossiella cryophila TaxID=43355 RepID=A0A7W7CCS7_9PSEU|nr:hypothetical protein [Crossiella cryophila]MBB4678777.1 hypothetical protein [Crossiella cryophila]
MTPHIDLPLLHRLLGLPERETPRALLRAARAAARTLPHLVLSLAERDGLPLGTGSTDELRRARVRAETYRRFLGLVQAEAGVRVMKGPQLAQRYPADLLRPAGDLDLVAADEARLWLAARAVLAVRQVEDIDLTVFQHSGHRDVVIALAWPSEDPLLDRGYKIEISTMAFPGDGGAVPIRAALPADPWLADLLALAEERHQRDFHAKDVLDVLVLAGDAPPGETVAAAAAGLYLAPELAELLDYAAGFASLGPLAPTLERLRAPAAAELARRARWHPAEAGAADSVADRLATGRPVYGMPLRQVSGREDWPVAELREVAGSTVLATPVADLLLVTGELVDPEQFTSVLRALGEST